MDVPVQMYPYGGVLEVGIREREMAKLKGLPKLESVKKSTGTTPMKPKKLGGLKKLKGL